MSSIKLSPKHGVNPTIPICFFCGKPRNEIAMMGKIGGRGEDPEMPMYALIDYEPCEECKKKFDQGVLLLEVTHTPNVENQPPIQTNAYPTGRCSVVKPEALKGDFECGSKALVLREDYRQMFGD